MPGEATLSPTLKRKAHYINMEEMLCMSDVGAHIELERLAKSAMDSTSQDERKLYATSSHKIMAEMTRQKYEALCGPAPSFPTEEECNLRFKESSMRVWQHFGINLEDKDLFWGHGKA
jgi:hypothetical protein